MKNTLKVSIEEFLTDNDFLEEYFKLDIVSNTLQAKLKNK